MIRNEWDEYKAIVGKLLPAFLSDLFQKDFKSDEFVQMFGLLEKAKEKFLGVYDYENAVKNACCTSWNANLSNPEKMKGENQFNFLVSAFDAGGLSHFDDGLVSTTLFMDKKPLLHRNRKAGFIYGMDAQDLVAMSIYDVNTASYYVDSGTRNGDMWPFTELPFYAGPGRVLCSCLGSEDTFDTFSCYVEKYLKHNQIGEIVLTSLAKPQGMLLYSDAGLKLKQGVYGYASLFQLPVVEYCHETNKCTTVFPERSNN